MNRLCARGGGQAAKCKAAEHPGPAVHLGLEPTNAGRLSEGLGFFTRPQHPSPSRLRFRMPCHVWPSVLSVLPTACSQHVRSRRTPGFAPRSPPKASLLPGSFSSPPPLLSCRLSLGKGGGELGEHGEEPGGGSRGRRRSFQTSTGQSWQGGSAFPCSPLSSSSSSP